MLEQIGIDVYSDLRFDTWVMAVLKACITNNVTESESGNKMSLWPYYSLFNHSCDPNVTERVSGGSMVLYATRPIKKGEELYVSYVPMGNMPRQMRQRVLRKWFGESCRCLRCERERPEL